MNTKRFGLFARWVLGFTLIVNSLGVTPAYAALTFTNKTTANGLGHNTVYGVLASGSTVYAATQGGLSISSDGGSSFANKTTANGLESNDVRGVYASGSMVYAATQGGLSISSDGGSTFTNKTTTNGLGHDNVFGVYASGSTVYAATRGGLSISTDSGSTFANKTTTDGLGNNIVLGVLASGSTVYAATAGGLSISTDGGSTFTNKTTANGLGHNFVRGVFASGSTVYAETDGGLSISTDGGSTFTNKTTANGLGNNVVRGVFVSGSTVYAATEGGLSISTDGGSTFINKTTADGLGHNFVLGVFVSGSTVYAATFGGLSIGFDDANAPTVSIDDVTLAEGDTGVTNAVFTVTLSNPSSQSVTVDFTTADGTATAGSDYNANSGTLTFIPGETSKPITIVVTTDTDIEADETFTLNLSNATNATIANATGTGTIQNDDIVITRRYAQPGGLTSGACNSWANACELRYALSIAVSGQEIWVGAGTYKPTGGTDRTATFTLKNGVVIYGGFAGIETLLTERAPATNITILSGDLNGDDGANFANNGDNSYHVLTGGGTNNTAILDGFTVTAGNANGGYPYYYGGGIYNNSSNPSLTNVTFSGNSAGQDGGGMSNISSDPSLTNVTFNGNKANNHGGGIYNLSSSPSLTNVIFNGNTATYGGGISNAPGSPSLTNVTFSGNSAAIYGGGIYNYSGTTVLNTGVFNNNSADDSGGAILNAGTLTLINSIVSDNHGANHGAIYNSGTLTLNTSTVSNNTSNLHSGGFLNGGVLTLNNSTVSGNAARATGGGIFNVGGTLNLNYSTVANNTSDSDNNGGNGGGIFNQGTVNLKSSIVAGNKNGTSGTTDATADCSGAITSQDYNLTGNGTGCTLSGTGNVTVTPADVFTSVLGALANNGGATQTHALLTGSPALDRILSGTNGCGTTFNFDQRGEARPLNGKCDIGAYEALDTLAPVVVSSIRANASPTNATSVDFTVTFSEPVHGVDTNDFTLATTGAVTGASITGVSGVVPGATYTVSVSTGSGLGAIRLDVIDDDSILDSATLPLGGAGVGNGNFTIGQTYIISNTPTRYVAPAPTGNNQSGANDCTDSGIPCATITYAIAQSNAGDTIEIAAGTYTEAGIIVNKNLTLSGAGAASTIVQAAVSQPAATNRVFFINSGVTANIEGMTIQNGNTSAGGGGIYNEGTLTLNASTVSGNSANFGGGIYNGRRLTLSNSTVSGNSASNWGGGIYHGGTLMTLDHTTISNNSAAYYGGIYNGGTLTLNYSTVSGNSASNYAGGIYNVGTLTLNNSTVSGNSASFGGGLYMSAGSVSISNSTIGGAGAGNISTGAGGGGGIYVTSGSLTLTTSTVSHNTATAGGAGGGIEWLSAGTLTIQTNSVISSNSASTGGGLFINAGTVNITSSTIGGAGAGNSSTGGGGGGIRVNGGSLTLTTTTVSHNTATPNVGGGIEWLSPGILTIQTNSVISSNSAIVGGGLYMNGGSANISNSTIGGAGAGNASTTYGGGIYNESGTIVLNTSVFNNNSAGDSGGAILNAGTLTLINSIVSDNPGANHGAIYNSGTLMLNSSIVSNNTSNLHSGGIFNGGALTLNNSTVSGNAARNTGGGLFNASGGTLTLNYSTVANNTSDSENNSGDNGGGIFNQGTVNLKSSIVAGNKNGTSGITDATADCSGAITSEGYNLTGSGTGCSLSGTGNVTVAPANVFTTVLGPLASNGGPTQTHALLTGSPAINQIPSAISGCGNTYNLDQRGQTRPKGEHCDIGAYEYEFFPVLYVQTGGLTNGLCNSWSNACELRYALSIAVPEQEIWVAAGIYKPSGGTDRTATFTLKNGVAIYGGFAGTETLLSQRDPVTNVTILSGDLNGDDGPSFANNGDNSYHVLSTGSGINSTAILDGFTITAGNANGTFPNDAGAGMYNNGGSPTLTDVTFSENKADYGGGMYNNSGNLTLTNVTFNGNSATTYYGGGIYNDNSSNLTLTNVTFSGNTASWGGGISNFGLLTVTNSTLSGNSATSAGGGIYNFDTLTVTNSTLSGNSALSGGGIFNANARTLTVTNSTLASNSASSGGGGILNGGTLTVTNSTFSGNSAVNGGGIISTGTLTLTNSTLSGNSAVAGGGGGIYTYNATSTLNYANTVIANSTSGGDCINDGGATIGANTNNLVEDGSCSAAFSGDPVLGALADNGGFTQTMALGADSPAINAGNNSTCATTDQRDVARPQGPACDIGAYEYEYTATTILYARSGGPSGGLCSSWATACELRFALASAVSGQEIWVKAGTYKPTSGTDRTTTFTLKNGVAIYGGFDGTETLLTDRNPMANVTILSGDIGTVNDISDNSYHVVTGSGTNNTAILNGFTITAGNANGTNPNDRGGGMFNDSGSNPTLTNLILTGNSSTYGAGMFNEGSSPSLTNVTFNGNLTSSNGGGLYNSSSGPNLTNVTFIGNTATNGGGMFNDAGSNPSLTNTTFSGNSAATYGGGMYNSGTTLSNTSVFNNNSAGDSGGAIFNTATLTLNTSIIKDNHGTNHGAIYNSSTLTLNNSTVSSNTSNLHSGGIFNGGVLTLNNSTVSSNASRATGGGLFNASGGTLNLNYSTVANNTSDSENNSGDNGGGIFNQGTVNLKSSIVAGNKNGTSGATDATADCSGAMTSQGYNLTGNGTGCSLSGTGNVTVAPADVFTTVLGALASNGGATDTHALLTGSPALDRIPSDTNECGTTFNLDQRGEARPLNGKCDIGAYEALDTIAPMVVSSLRADANPTNASSVDFTVTFSESVNDTTVDASDFALTTTGVTGASITAVSGSNATYTVSVSTGSGFGTIRLDVIDDDSILDAVSLPLGGTGSGNGNFTIGQRYLKTTTTPTRYVAPAPTGIDTDDCSDSLNPCRTITYAIAQSNAGDTIEIAAGTYTEAGITVDKNLILIGAGAGSTIVQAATSPGIATNRVFFINSGVTATIEGLTIQNGNGGLFNNGTLTMSNSTVSNNSTFSGSGLYNQGTMTLNNSIVSGNSSSYEGGGIKNVGTLTINNTTISGNSGSHRGGGLQNYGTVTMSNSNVSGNSANGPFLAIGGGIYNSGTITLSNSTIIGNTAAQIGGGMYNDYSSPNLTNVTFSGNSASVYGGGMYNDHSSPTLTNVTIQSNTADQGGGIYNVSSSPTLTNVTFVGNTATYGGGMSTFGDGSLTMTNVTMSGNTAIARGGAMYGSSPNATLTNVTISGNTAAYGGAISYEGGNLVIKNSIIWINWMNWWEANDIYNDSSTQKPIIMDSIVSFDCLSVADNCTNVILADPLLGALADNGGFTQTRALGFGSAAIDAGNNATCAATDQRGVARPQGAACDMGAYEYNNAAPVITEGASVSVTMSENGSPTAFDLTLNATDLEGATLTWSVSSPAGNGMATASGTGLSKVIGYTPITGYSGTDSFDVQVSDGNGGIDTITVNVTIEAVNDAPVITESDPQAVMMSEDGSPTAFALTLHATDVDSVNLAWSISTPANNGSALVGAASGVVSYTPTTNYNGTDSFQVQVSDGTLSDTITVNVTIQPVNDPPVITEGTSVNVTMSANGSPTAFALTLHATDIESAAALAWSISTQAQNGNALVGATSGVVNYTPTANYNGTDSFDVQASDGNGGTDTITVNVTIRPVLTVTADPQTITYGDAEPAFTFTYSGFIGADGPGNIDTRPTCVASGVHPRNVDQYRISCSGGSDDKYDFRYADNDLTITARPITVTAIARSKVYGDMEPGLTYQVTSGSLLASDSFSGNLTRNPGENAGDYDILQGTLTAGSNYDLTYIQAKLTITAKPITVTALPKTKLYGDPDTLPLGFTFTPALISGDSFSGSLSRAPGENVGVYAITQGTLVLSSNYNLVYVGNDLTITAKAITVTADPRGKVYGSADPSFTFTYSGFVNGDDETDIDTSPTCTISAAHIDVGPYPITCSGGVDDNYNFIYVDGTLTIGQRPITVTAGTDTKIYDGNTSSTGVPTITSGTLAFSDTASFIQTFDNKNVGTGKTLIPSGNVNDGNGGNNYAVTFVEDNTGVITSFTLTIAGITANNKIYDGNTVATIDTSSAALVGVIASDDVQLNVAGATGDFNDKNVGNGKTVTVSGLLVTGTDAGNYILIQPTTTANITARPITVTAEAKTKIYGDPDPALSYTFTPALISGDSFSGDLSRAAGENVGVYAITQGTLTAGSNYNLTYISANLTITPPADLIFMNGFESGDLSAWSASVTDLGDLSVTSAAALVESFGMQAVINNNTSIYVTDNTPNAEPRYRARFYFDPNSIAMSSGNAHYIFYGNSGATQVLRIEFQCTGGACPGSGLYQLRAELRNDANGWTTSGWITITDAPHFIEVDWRASTAVGANNGGLTYWIDGAQQANFTNVDNDTRRIDSAQLGAVFGIDTATRGTYYFDDFESRTQTYIGGNPNLPPPPPLPDLIFADSFEAGNLSAWSASVTDVTDLSVTAAAALVGSSGLQALIDNNPAIYLTDNTPNAEPLYRARFHFDPNSIAMNNNNAHYIFYGNSGAVQVIRLEFRRSAGLYQLRASLRNDGAGWTNTAWFTITDAPHSIEFDWRASTAVGANDGGLTFWLDGVQQANLTGVDNDTRRIDSIQLGAVSGIDTATRGTYYFDAFESRRQTYIGP